MAPQITGVILAAGLSSRMGPANKLTTLWQGKPLVVHVAEAAMASRLNRVVVVTGHQSAQVTALLPAGAKIVFNPDFASGMASSLKAGVIAAGNADGIMVLLGDMPLVTARHINSLIDVFAQEGPGSVVQAVCGRKPGNPVLFSKVHFPALMKVQGDAGARKLIRDNQAMVMRVDTGQAAARDFDVPEAFGAEG